MQYNTQYLYTKVANDKQNKNFTYDLYELWIATVGKTKIVIEVWWFSKKFFTFAHWHREIINNEREIFHSWNAMSFFILFYVYIHLKAACLFRSTFCDLTQLIFEFCWVDWIKFYFYYFSCHIFKLIKYQCISCKEGEIMMMMIIKSRINYLAFHLVYSKHCYFIF